MSQQPSNIGAAIALDAKTKYREPSDDSQTAGRIPGNMAIWVGIFSERTEFTMMFIIYIIARSHYPETITRLRTL